MCLIIATTFSNLQLFFTLLCINQTVSLSFTLPINDVCQITSEVFTFFHFRTFTFSYQSNTKFSNLNVGSSFYFVTTDKNSHPRSFLCIFYEGSGFHIHKKVNRYKYFSNTLLLHFLA